MTTTLRNLAANVEQLAANVTRLIEGTLALAQNQAHLTSVVEQMQTDIDALRLARAPTNKDRS